MPDAVVVVVRAVKLPDVQRGLRVVDALVGGRVAFVIAVQVERFADHACLEERRIALGVDFRHLIFDGIDRQAEFAGLHVGMNHDAVAIGVHLRGVVLAAGVNLVALRHRAVQLVAHDPRGVVAFQLEDEREVVAQIVLRQRLAQRQVALIFTARDASLQRHLRLVPQIHLAHVLRPVVPGGVGLRIGIDEVAVVLEHVAFLHDLYAVAALRHAQLEGALVVGGDGLARGVDHLLAVAQEAHVRHGDARAFVEHEAREDVVVGLREVDVRLQVDVVVKGDALRGEAGLSARVFDGQRVFAVADIDEVADFEESGAVGHARARLGPLDAHRLGGHGVVGQSGAVGQAHIAAHHTCRLAAALHGRLADVDALTLGHTLDGVDVVVLRTHRPVFVDGLRVLLLQRVHLLGRHFVVAENAVVVGLSAHHTPRQLDAALLGLCLGEAHHHIVVKLVYGLFAALGLGYRCIRHGGQGQIRAALLHRHAEVVVHTRGVQLQRQLSCLALLFRQLAALGVAHFLAHRLVDVEHHLGTRVPNLGVEII